MTDRYQPLRDAIAGPIIRSPRIAVRAAGSICVGDTRPVDTVEDLERGLHIEILGGENTEAEAQFIAAADPDTIAALLADYDRLQRELEFIAYANPSRWDADMRDQFQEWAQNRARAALADGEKTSE